MEKPIFYHQEGCGMCKALEMMLQRKGIDYESVLITLDNVEVYRDKGITGIPALEVEGNILIKKEASDWVRGQ